MSEAWKLWSVSFGCGVFSSGLINHLVLGEWFPALVMAVISALLFFDSTARAVKIDRWKP